MVSNVRLNKRTICNEVAISDLKETIKQLSGL